MAKKNTKKRSNSDVIAEVTADLIAQIEAGTPPWVQPWTGDALRMPQNGVTGRPYNGINILVLWTQAQARGYSDHRWMTFNQAKKAGGCVRKGEKGTKIVFWRFIEREEETTTGDLREVRITIARTFTVFNAEQVDGLELEPLPAPKCYAHDDVTPAALADSLAALAGTLLTVGGSRACFMPSADLVKVPDLHRFERTEAYAATLCHELVHWTGTEERCDRNFGKRFGDDAYAVEELVAEMGSAFLCAALGIRGEMRHAEYLGHWARVAKADTYALTTAAKQAEKAVAFLLEAGGGVEAIEARAATYGQAKRREHHTEASYAMPAHEVEALQLALF